MQSPLYPIQRQASLSWKTDGTACLILLAMVAGLGHPLLWENQTLFWRDFSTLVYPMKHFITETFRQGALPFWNHNLFGGEPFLAFMYPGVFYPPNLIFFLDGFTSAFNGFYLFHFALLGFSVYFLLRHWGRTPAASLCASATALFGGFYLSLAGTTSPFFAAVWTPSIFLWFDRYLGRRKPADFLGTVALLAIQVLAGSPEYSVITVTMLFAWAVYFFPEIPWWRPALRKALTLGTMVVLAWGLTAPQLIPTLLLAKDSTRGQGMTFDRHAEWSMEPRALSELVTPKTLDGYLETEHPEPFHFIQSFYMGLFSILFLGLGMVRVQIKPFRFWIMVFLLGLFFALGKHNPLYSFFFEWVPFWDLFRYPEKFFFPCAFALVILTGYGVDELVESLAAKRMGIRFPAVLGLGIVVASMAFTLAMPNRGFNLSIFLLTGFIGLCAWILRLGRGTSLLKITLLVLIVVDLAPKHHILLPTIDRSFYDTEPEAAKWIRSHPGFYRLFNGDIQGLPDKIRFPGTRAGKQIKFKECLYPDLGTLYGMNYADGLSGWGLELKDQRLWTEWFNLSGPRQRLRILRRSNVAFLFLDHPSGAAVKDVRVSAFGRLEVLGGVLPRAFLVPGVRQVEASRAAAVYFEETFDPLTEVLVSEPVQLRPAADFQGRVSAIVYRPNRVSVRTWQTGDGVLVLLDTWFPGWKVTVDGHPARLLRANHFYRAVQLTRGDHRLEFVFEPDGFRLGLVIFAGTLVLLLGFLITSPRGRRARPGANVAVAFSALEPD